MTTRPRHSMEAADHREGQIKSYDRAGVSGSGISLYRKRGGGFLCAPDPDRSAELLWVQHTGPDTERRVLLFKERKKTVNIITAVLLKLNQRRSHIVLHLILLS